MFKTPVAILWLSLTVAAQGKLGETVPELVKRFGRDYAKETLTIGERYKFRSQNVTADVTIIDGASVAETYYSDHALNQSGEPPNDIVRAILKTNVPSARWLEIDAAPLGADYALRSSDNEYIATLKYSGSHPENMVWTMTVARARIELITAGERRHAAAKSGAGHSCCQSRSTGSRDPRSEPQEL